MGFSCGIVGLPNVGKTTIFNSLTKADAEAGNYPFCTIDPNYGVTVVPDERLVEISRIIRPERMVPTTLKFVDVAGLVKGASKGEGLGNQFLGVIRNVDAIAHVLRCFHDNDVTHISGSVDPVRDAQVVTLELILADMEVVEKRMEKLKKMSKGKGAINTEEISALEYVREKLDQGVPLRNVEMDENISILTRELQFLSAKTIMYIANIDEDALSNEDVNIPLVENMAGGEGCELVKICGSLEAELVEMDDEDRRKFMGELGIKNSGLNKIVEAGFRMLNLVTFFTTDGPEVKAWTILRGTAASKAAGEIHSDFERGFIRAEVMSWEDLIENGSPQALKEKGLVKLEGKDYVIKDGDVVHFRIGN